MATAPNPSGGMIGPPSLAHVGGTRFNPTGRPFTIVIRSSKQYRGSPVDSCTLVGVYVDGQTVDRLIIFPRGQTWLPDDELVENFKNPLMIWPKHTADGCSEYVFPWRLSGRRLIKPEEQDAARAAGFRQMEQTVTLEFQVNVQEPNVLGHNRLPIEYAPTIRVDIVIVVPLPKRRLTTTTDTDDAGAAA